VVVKTDWGDVKVICSDGTKPSVDLDVGEWVSTCNDKFIIASTEDFEIKIIYTSDRIVFSPEAVESGKPVSATIILDSSYADKTLQLRQDDCIGLYDDCDIYKDGSDYKCDLEFTPSAEQDMLLTLVLCDGGTSTGYAGVLKVIGTSSGCNAECTSGIYGDLDSGTCKLSCDPWTEEDIGQNGCDSGYKCCCCCVEK